MSNSFKTVLSTIYEINYMETTNKIFKMKTLLSNLDNSYSNTIHSKMSKYNLMRFVHIPVLKKHKIKKYNYILGRSNFKYAKNNFMNEFQSNNGFSNNIINILNYLNLNMTRDINLNFHCEKSKNFVINVKCKKTISKLFKSIIVLYHYYIKKRTVAEIIKIENISKSSIDNIIRCIRKNGIAWIDNLITNIYNTAMTNHKINNFLNTNRDNKFFKILSLKKIYQKYGQFEDDTYSCSYSQFIYQFKQLGYKYRVIKRNNETKINQFTKTIIENFLYEFNEIMFSGNKFEILFIDESSIHPSNYKQRWWSQKAFEVSNIPIIQYNLLSFIGAITKQESIAIQFSNKGFCRKSFCSFLNSVIIKMKNKTEKGKQLIIFMDNCPFHHGEDVYQIFKKYKVICLYNIPNYCKLNLIEYCWEAVKRKIRQSIYTWKLYN